MSNKKTVAVAVGASLAILSTLLAVRFLTEKPTSIQGAVITRETDPTKELAIADAEVTVIDGSGVHTVRSDASGYFQIGLPRRIRRGMPLTLRFRHPDYQRLDMYDVGGNKLYIAQLEPLVRPAPQQQASEIRISNVLAEYSITTTSTVNIGSAVKTFEIENTANVPCQGRRPCSPDGKWKAAVGSVAIDAGAGNQFHNARVSCIAGPCPFTRIEDNNLSRESQTIRVSALNWSDTATFLLEAEVYKPVVNNLLRRSYPVIFDRALTFTMPAAAEGVSIEAEVNGMMVVFPLGPALILSWANCQVVVNKDQTKVYRCELKPGYRFQEEQAAPSAR